MAGHDGTPLKVAVLALVSTVILLAFAVVMTGFTLAPMTELEVDFANPGALGAGAPVRMAGVKVGHVRMIALRTDPAGHARTVARVTMSIEERARSAIHEDAAFFVALGSLGESFLSIDSGTLTAPVLATGAVPYGIDPPRLDLFVAQSYQLLDATTDALHKNRKLVDDLVTDSAGTLRNTNLLLAENAGRADRILSDVAELREDATGLVRGVNARFIENPRIDRVRANTASLVDELGREGPPLAEQGKRALANLERVQGTIGSPSNVAKREKAIADLAETAGRAGKAAADTADVAKRIFDGEGTMGGFLAEEEMWDELQATARELKRNPWKLFWKN